MAQLRFVRRMRGPRIRTIAAVGAFLITVVLCLSSVCAHPLTAPELLQGRDLSSYEAGGDYDATEGIHVWQRHGRIPKIGQLRTFLWNHWHSKRKGYATLTESGVDTFWTTYIFTEPTQANDWHIVLRGVSPNIHRGPNGIVRKPNRIFDLPDVRSLAYSTRQSGDAPGAPKVLVFRDKDGKEVWRL
jgi:hypothetical protein